MSAAAIFGGGWGLLLAPTANSGLGPVQKDAIGGLVLLVAAAALGAAGQRTPALIYAVAIIVNGVLMFALRAPAVTVRRSTRLSRRRKLRMQLAPSLHRLGTSSLVNSYLIDEAGRLTVVDTGLPGLWKDLLAELRAMGRALTDIHAVLLTHGDVDHAGFAERLRRDHGVPVWVSEADAAEARGEVPKPNAAVGPMRIVPITQFLVYAALHGGLRSTPIREVQTFVPGAVLDVPGSPRVIGLPGHTPGSVAFSVPSVDAVFMGDAMTTRSVTSGKVGPALGPFTVNPAEALSLLDALADLTPRWVLPGHGDVWTGGLPEAVRLIRASVAR